MYQPSPAAGVLFSWSLLNIPLFFLMAVGFLTGTLQPFFHDITYITHFMFVFFLGAVLHSGWVSHQLSLLLTDSPATRVYRSIKDLPHGLEIIYLETEKMLHFTRFSMNLLVALGFLGTILGVIIGFQTFPPDIFSDPSKMQGFIRAIMSGFAVELHTLLMGLIGKMWLSIIVMVQERVLNKIHLKILSPVS